MARKRKYDIKGISKDISILDAFEKLQVNIGLSSVDNKLQVIQITSSVQDEGKTTVAVNLANSYAVKGAKVLLVDLDIRRPKVHRNFNKPNENGLVDYAAGKIKKEDLIVHTKNNIDIILTGSKTPYPVKLLESDLIKSFLDDARKTYDYIILDTPPVAAVVDPIIVSKLTDGVIFVVEADRTKRTSIREAIHLLEKAQANIIGLVIKSVRDNFDYKYKYKYQED
jgi:capsular exopolysaccharide synthesis family protein